MREVLYLHHTFPGLTATFVYREARAVADRDVPLLHLSCKRPGGIVSEDARGFVAPGSRLRVAAAAGEKHQQGDGQEHPHGSSPVLWVPPRPIAIAAARHVPRGDARLSGKGS